MAETNRPKNFVLTEFANSVEDITPKHSSLLGKTALSLATSIPSSEKSLKRHKDNGYSEKALNNLAKVLDDDINKYVSGDYDVEKEVREPLAEAPNFLKIAQNNIFSFLIGEHDNFITNVINPQKTDLRGSFRLSFDRGEPNKYYDLVGKFTEKDEAGNYTVPDGTVKNFISWYHYRVANINKEIARKMNIYIRDYKTLLKTACDNNFLPKEFEKRAELLNNGSTDGISVETGVLDAISSYKNGSIIFEGNCFNNPFSKDKPIKLRLDHWLERDSRQGYCVILSYDGLRALNHELTHAAAGDIIDFGSDQANEIINEALTEIIGAIITRAARLEHHDKSEYSKIMEGVWPFGGNTYRKERKVLEFLSSRGQKTIDPMTFFSAYAETDKNYDLIRDGKKAELPFLKGLDDAQASKEYESFRKKPYRTYGPAQQKLINALLESFPECKDLKDIGKMIVEKYNEFKKS